MAAAAAVHGHTGMACASCPNTKTCDCPCNVCVLARRCIAGHICLDCGEICGYTQCKDCSPCDDCGRKGCDGFVCPAADYDPSDYPCDECKRPGCDGGMWCPANDRDDCSTDSEMEERMRDEREEEDRRFRAQMARRTAAAKPLAGRTFTITLTSSALSGAGLMSAVAAAAGAGGGK